MYRVSIIGHFADGHLFLDGQTVKTKILAEELKKILGFKEIKTVDTYGWKSNPAALLIKSYFSIKKGENIIILPAEKGLKIFVPLFLSLNKLYHKKLHYVVIGGWLPELLEKNVKLKKLLSTFDGIYVETNTMVKSLKKLGLNNTIYLPNFKNLRILEEDELVYPTEEPYKLCTFSRVMKEKGIEDASEVVTRVNAFYGREVYNLDIYGPIDEKYRGRFQELIKDFPKFTSYKGMVSFESSVEVLKNYFALLFPTNLKTEGIPGTIIDAYAAGVPVLASNWDSASEIVEENKTGFIYNFLDNSKLEEILIQMINDPDKTNEMRKNCLIRAKDYSAKIVVEELIKCLR